MDWHTRYMQQARWTASLRAYLLQAANLPAARRVLDVGCGTGVLLEEHSHTVGLSIHGLDIDLSHLSIAAEVAPGARLVQGDAHKLPYPDNLFDIAWCHFVLLWLEDPLKAAREMARVVRPGGAVIAMSEPDYGARIDYPAPLEALGRAQADSLKLQGADPYIGRRLRAIFNQAGLTAIEAGVMGGQWKSPPVLQDWEMEWTVLENDLNLLKNNSPAAGDLVALKKLDWAAWQSGERLLFVPTFYTIGCKPL